MKSRARVESMYDLDVHGHCRLKDGTTLPTTYSIREWIDAWERGS